LYSLHADSSPETQVETQLAEFKKINSNNLPELQELNMRSLERTEQQIDDIERQFDSLNARKLYLDAELVQLSPNSMSFSSTGERIYGFEDRYGPVNSAFLMSPILLFYSLSDSVFLAYQSRQPLLQALIFHVSSVNSDLNALAKSKVRLLVKQEKLEAGLLKSPQVEQEYKTLVRDYDNARLKYREIKSKQMEADIAQTMEKGRKGERFTRQNLRLVIVFAAE
jgi:hypothetical protein